MQPKGRRGNSGVTIHDVARAAGVSPMTVSRVVSGEKNVRPATRERVAAVVRELGYSPNLAARTLASAETVRIGLLYSNPSAAYLSEFLVGSLEQSSFGGRQLILERCDTPDSERAAIEKLLGAGVNGIILPPPLCDSPTALAAVAGIPAVAVATGRPAESSSVRIDDKAAALAMTRRLIQLGHSDIGFIIGHPNQTASAQRHAGFLEAMAEAGLKVAPDQVVQGYFTYRSGLEAAQQLLAQPTRPSAIFASNDDMAAATIAVAHRQGLNVPGDLTVVGYDDSPLATTIWPALTTVRQPIADMARAAVDILVEDIRNRRAGEPGVTQHQLMDFALIERESSGPGPNAKRSPATDARALDRTAPNVDW